MAERVGLENGEGLKTGAIFYLQKQPLIAAGLGCDNNTHLFAVCSQPLPPTHD